MPTTHSLAAGAVHAIPADLRRVLVAVPGAAEAWNGLTPLGRNEWICWVTSVQKPETRADHVRRVGEELLQGKRRPCCWIGCIHRPDKRISPSVRGILARRSSKKS